MPPITLPYKSALVHSSKLLAIGAVACTLAVVLEYLRSACLVSMLYWSSTHRFTTRVASALRGQKHKHSFGMFVAELAVILMYSRLLTQTLCLVILANLIVTMRAAIRKNIMQAEVPSQIKIIGKLYQVSCAVYSPAQLHLWCLKFIRHGPTKGSLLALLSAYKISGHVMFTTQYDANNPQRLWSLLICTFFMYTVYTSNCMLNIALTAHGPMLIGMILFIHMAREQGIKSIIYII